MRIALLGNGKTGSKIISLAEQKGLEYTIFNRSNVPCDAKLKGHDMVISFLPGPAFVSYIDLLLDVNIGVVCGSTGFEWPGGIEQFTKTLQDQHQHWVYSGNFSKGNSIALSIIEILSRSGLTDQFEFNMTEVHHKQKIDAPSGTALLWREKIGHNVEINSIREGDEKGMHQLTLTSPSETITITHQVSNRDAFAEGALLAAELLHNNRRRLRPGMFDLQQLMQINYLS